MRHDDDARAVGRHGKIRTRVGEALNLRRGARSTSKRTSAAGASRCQVIASAATRDQQQRAERRRKPSDPAARRRCRYRDAPASPSRPAARGARRGCPASAPRDPCPGSRGSRGRRRGDTPGASTGSGRRFRRHDRADDRRRRLAVERPPARDHLVEHAAEREDVAARVGGAALELLGRHVCNVPRMVPARRQRRRSPSRRRGRRVRPLPSVAWRGRSRAASRPSA